MKGTLMKTSMIWKTTFILVGFFVGSSRACLATNSTASSGARQVAVSADTVVPLAVGDKIPPVMLTNADGMEFDLTRLIKNQPTVLIFYRGGWCVYCNRQLSTLRDIETPLQKLGYQIIAVSPDSVEKIRESLKKYDLKYMLLSDGKAQAIQAFGLAYHVDDAAFQDYKKQFGIDLESASGATHHLLPVPAAFVIDKSGVIRYRYFNPDYKVRVDSQALLQAAQQALASSKKG